MSFFLRKPCINRYSVDLEFQLILYVIFWIRYSLRFLLRKFKTQHSKHPKSSTYQMATTLSLRQNWRRRIQKAQCCCNNVFSSWNLGLRACVLIWVITVRFWSLAPAQWQKTLRSLVAHYQYLSSCESCRIEPTRFVTSELKAKAFWWSKRSSVALT